MRFHSVGSRLSAGMAAVILSFIILSLFITAQLTRKFGEQEIFKNLLHGTTVYRKFIALQQELIKDKARLLAETPYLKATVNIGDLEHETAFYTAMRLVVIGTAPLPICILTQKMRSIHYF